MFNNDFFPTPIHVIEIMLDGLDLSGKVILEPSAGKGNIIDAIGDRAKEVLSCELHPDLAKIAASKSRFLCHDFLSLKSTEISHIDYIIMNPPFSADANHVLHAYNIAPQGTIIRALVNSETINNPYSRNRKQLKTIIADMGSSIDLGSCFDTAERKTNVNVSMITLKKGEKSDDDWSEYFELEDSDVHDGSEGIMTFDVIRDVVNRYVGAVKLYDDVMENAVKMASLTHDIRTNDDRGGALVFTLKEGDKNHSKATFMKELQKNAWKSVFHKMDMSKYVTKSLLNDLNKFVEKQTEIPFTMKNVYTMIQTIAGTHGTRMDQALLDVFDTLTKHNHDNRYGKEGWKTNSCYMLNKKFILPHMTDQGYYGGMRLKFNGNEEKIEDLCKALNYITGQQYKAKDSLYNLLNCTYEKDPEFYKSSDRFKSEMKSEYNSYYNALGELAYRMSDEAKAKFKEDYPTFDIYLDEHPLKLQRVDIRK